MKTRSAPVRIGGLGTFVIAALGIHFGLWLLARQAPLAFGSCAGCTYMEWWDLTLQAAADIWRDLW
jgi:hypothetical protein